MHAFLRVVWLVTVGNTALARAPMLDGVVSLFTWVPWAVGYAIGGWPGVVGSVVGEAVALYLWMVGHELMHPDAVRAPRIVKTVNRLVGRWQNHLCLWWSVLALPGFLGIRLSEVVVYPVLVRLLRFPNYKSGEWINCSRQKFDGLGGHDLIWCLYCDWVTGVYSLGTEMLRNLESFWCPIRYDDPRKCANCAREFPDLNAGWVPITGTMAQVTNTLDQMYAPTGTNAWFGHPARLTVKGKQV